MKVSQVFAVVAVLALGAQAARAQVLGLPFYPTPTGTGVLAAAEYAHPASETSVMAVRGGLGFGSFGVTAVVGQWKVTGADAVTTYGATAAMKLFGGGVLPLSISAQAGAGMYKAGGTTYTSFPVGAAVRANVALFPVKPFAVGYYTLGDGKNEFRVSVGADYNIILGLGVHAAYDMGTANTWGVGAHFNFRLPSL